MQQNFQHYKMSTQVQLIFHASKLISFKSWKIISLFCFEWNKETKIGLIYHIGKVIISALLLCVTKCRSSGKPQKSVKKIAWN
jgi:hypothetical protein